MCAINTFMQLLGSEGKVTNGQYFNCYSASHWVTSLACWALLPSWKLFDPRNMNSAEYTNMFGWSWSAYSVYIGFHQASHIPCLGSEQRNIVTHIYIPFLIQVSIVIPTAYLEVLCCKFEGWVGGGRLVVSKCFN